MGSAPLFTASAKALAVAAAFLTALASGPAGAAPAEPSAGVAGKASGGALLAKASGASPVTVTAATLTADNKKSTVVYSGDVVVKKDDITLYADNVTILLAARKAEGGEGMAGMFSGAGKIETITARGSVRIIQGDKTATSAEAVYHEGANKIVLTGEPRVWQGGNVLSGSKITYDITGDTFVVEQARTILQQEAASPKAPPVKDGSPEAGP